MEKKEYIYSITRNDLDKVLEKYFKDQGYENVDLKNVKYNISFNSIPDSNGLIVKAELISALVTFNSNGIGIKQPKKEEK